jgi:hypothetical protein
MGCSLWPIRRARCIKENSCELPSFRECQDLLDRDAWRASEGAQEDCEAIVTQRKK